MIPTLLNLSKSMNRCLRLTTWLTEAAEEFPQLVRENWATLQGQGAQLCEFKMTTLAIQLHYLSRFTLLVLKIPISIEFLLNLSTKLGLHYNL